MTWRQNRERITPTLTLKSDENAVSFPKPVPSIFLCNGVLDFNMVLSLELMAWLEAISVSVAVDVTLSGRILKVAVGSE